MKKQTTKDGIIRKYNVNNNWKPFARHHQFGVVFKNGMYGFSDARCKFPKIRFFRKMRATPLLFSLKNQPKFGNDKYIMD